MVPLDVRICFVCVWVSVSCERAHFLLFKLTFCQIDNHAHKLGVMWELVVVTFESMRKVETEIMVANVSTKIATRHSWQFLSTQCLSKCHCAKKSKCLASSYCACNSFFFFSSLYMSHPTIYFYFCQMLLRSFTFANLSRSLGIQCWSAGHNQSSLSGTYTHTHKYNEHELPCSMPITLWYWMCATTFRMWEGADSLITSMLMKITRPTTATPKFFFIHFFRWISIVIQSTKKWFHISSFSIINGNSLTS